jgi:CubicO group peptidase (beta-lactamase class C family)
MLKRISTAVIVWLVFNSAPVADVALGEERSVFPAADWPQQPPESQGVDPVKLAAAVAYMDQHFQPDGANRLVVVRNGYVIWKGPESDACQEIYSATKVFTSTVLGVQIGEGKCTLDTLAIEHLPELDDQFPAYAKIRLRHLASMTGGYKGKVANVTDGQRWGDPVVYVTTPAAPAFEPGGSQIDYNDHDVHLLGRILSRIAEEPLKTFFARRIAEPIGMRRWDWGINGVVDGADHHNAAGTPTLQGNGGVRTTPLELARLGLLYLNRGNWNGEQLLPADFVDAAVGTQVPADLPGRSRSRFSGAYGFYWWTNGMMAHGQRRWPSAPPGTYTAHGYGANFCFVIPEWNMVLVRLGTAPVKGEEALWDKFLGKLRGE